MLAAVRKRYETVSVQYRQQAHDEINQDSMPDLNSIVLLGSGMCVFALCALIIGLGTLQ